jgi:hypothetical protein
MTNKKILIILFGCIFIVGFILIGFILYQGRIQPEIIDLPIKEIPLPERDRQILSHFEVCLTREERPILKPKEDATDRFYLILEALSQRDEKSCLKLEEEIDKDAKNECLRYFYIANALLTKNYNYCEKLGNLTQNIDWQKRCFATLKNDVSFCEKIKSLFKKESCKAIILGLEQCEYLSGYYKIPITRVESIGGVITKRKEIKEISEEEAKNFCRRESYITKAIRKQDITICEQIGIEQYTLMSFCRILASPNPKEEFNNLHKNFCYEKFAFEVARIKNDSSICEKIPAKQERNLALYQNCLAQF